MPAGSCKFRWKFQGLVEWVNWKQEDNRIARNNTLNERGMSRTIFFSSRDDSLGYLMTLREGGGRQGSNRNLADLPVQYFVPGFGMFIFKRDTLMEPLFQDVPPPPSSTSRSWNYAAGLYKETKGISICLRGRRRPIKSFG